MGPALLRRRHDRCSSSAGWRWLPLALAVTLMLVAAPRWAWAQLCSTTMSDTSMSCSSDTYAWHDEADETFGTTIYLALTGNSYSLLDLTAVAPDVEVFFDGRTFTNLYVSSHGFIAFSGECLSFGAANCASFGDPANDPPSSPNAALFSPDPLVAPFWEDLDPNTADGSVTTGDVIWYRYEDPDASAGTGDELFILTFWQVPHTGNPGATVTFQVRIYADQHWEIAYHDVNGVTTDDDGNNEVIGWENTAGSGNGQGVYVFNDSDGPDATPTTIANEQIRLDPDTSPCGEVFTWNVTGTESTSCDVIVHDFQVSGDLTINAPATVTVENEAAGSVSTSISGTVTIEPGATLYYETDNRQPGFVNAMSGTINVQGYLPVSTSLNETDSEDDFQWDGIINVDGGDLSTVNDGDPCAVEASLCYRGDKYMVQRLGSQLNVTNSGHVHLGYWILESGATADFSGPAGVRDSQIDSLLEVRNGASLTFGGDHIMHVRFGPIDCDGTYSVEGNATLQAEGQTVIDSDEWSLVARDDCDFDLSGTAVLDSTWGVRLEAGAQFDLSSTAAPAFSILTATEDWSIATGGLVTVTDSGVDLAGDLPITANSTLSTAGAAAVSVAEDTTIEAGSTLTHNASGLFDSGLGLTVSGTVNHGGAGDLTTSGIGADLDVNSGASVTSSGTGDIIVGDDVDLFPNASISITDGGLSVGQSVQLHCLAGGGGTAQLDWGGTGGTVPDFIVIGFEDPPPASCDAVLNLSATNVIADALVVRGDGGVFTQTAGTLDLTGDYNLTGYGLRLENDATASFEGGATNVTNSVRVGSTSTLDFSNTSTAAVDVTGSWLQRGTTTIDGGSLTVDGTFTINDVGDVIMQADSTGTVTLNGLLDIQASGTGLGLFQMGHDIDADVIDVTLGGAVTNDGQLLMAGDVDVSIVGMMTNDGSQAGSYWRLTDTAEVAAGAIDNAGGGLVEILTNGRFTAFSPFNNSATVTHDSAAESLGTTFWNGGGTLTLASSGDLTLSGQLNQDSGLIEFIGANAILTVQTGARISGGTVDLVPDATLVVGGLHPAFPTASLFIEETGTVMVTGGALTADNDVAVMCGAACGQLQVDSGTVTLTNAAADIVADGDGLLTTDNFVALGGTFNGGGVHAIDEALVRFENEVDGNFTGQLTVDGTAAVNFHHADTGASLIEFAGGGSVAGAVSHGQAAAGVEGDVTMGSTFTVSGTYDLNDDAADDAADLTVNGTFAVSGGAVTMDGTNRLDSTQDIQVSGGSLDADGAVTALTGLSQSGGAITVDAATSVVDVQNAGATSYTLSGGTLTVADGSFTNHDTLSATAGTVTLSGGTSALTVTATRDATFGGTSALSITGGTVTAARDLLITGSGAVSQTGATADTTVTRTVQVGGTLTLNFDAPADFSAGSLSVIDPGTVDLDGGSAWTFDLTGTLPDSRAPAYCDTGSDACSIASTSSDAAAISVGSNVTLSSTQAVYISSGTVDVAAGGALTVAGAGGADNVVFVDATGQLDVSGTVDSTDDLISSGTLNTFGPSGALSAGGYLRVNGGTADFAASTTVSSGLDLEASGDSVVTSDAAVTVGFDLVVNDADWFMVSGTVNAARHIWPQGSGSTDQGLFDQQGGETAFDHLDIGPYGDLHIADGAVARATSTNSTGELSILLSPDGDLVVDGVLDLQNDADGLSAGVSSGGSSLAVESGCTLTVNGTGLLDIQNELHVQGAVTNNGVVNVSRDSTDTVRSTVGCDRYGGSCNNTGSVTNHGDIHLGNDLRVYGTFTQAAGMLDLGCQDMPDDFSGGAGVCTPSGDDTHNGALHIFSGGLVDLQGGAITTSTGNANIVACSSASAVTVQGTLQGSDGTLDVNGNLCIAGSGLVDLGGTAFGTNATVTLNGQTSPATTNDGDVLIHSGGTLSLEGFGRLIAHDIRRGAGLSFVQLSNQGGSQSVTVDGGPLTVEFPFIQLDTAGADAANNLTVADLTQSGGTIWADGVVSLNGVGQTSVLSAVVPTTTEMLAGTLSVAAGHTLDVGDDAAVRANVGAYAGTPSAIAGVASFTDTSAFDTNKDVQVTGTLDFDVSATLDITADRALEVQPLGAVTLADTAAGSIDHVWLREYSAPNSGGSLQLAGDATLDVAQADTSAYYVGGDLTLAEQSRMTTTNLVIRSSSSVEPARVSVTDQAHLAVDAVVDTCVTPDLDVSSGGPVFTDDPQACSWIYDYGELQVTSAGSDLLVPCSTQPADACAARTVCRNSGDQRPCDSTSTADCSCWEPGFVTNERLIVNVRQLPASDLRFPLGFVVDGGLALKVVGPITATSPSEDAINPRRDSVVGIINDGQLWSFRVHGETLGPAGYAGRIGLFNGGVLRTDIVDLDSNTQLAFLGDDSAVYVTQLFDGPAGSFIEALPNTYPSFAEPPAVDVGKPAGTACGHGGGAAVGPAGAGQAGAAGTCATCFTFVPDSISGETAPSFGRGGSSGGDGTGGPGGARVGSVTIVGEDSSLIQLSSTVRADGEDALDVVCGGGGSSGGGVYIDAYDLQIGGNSSFSATGGDGAFDGASLVGGGGSGGTIFLRYRNTVTPLGGNVLDHIRDADVSGGAGFEAGSHGTMALVGWDAGTRRIEDPDTGDAIPALVTTALVWRTDPAQDPAPSDYAVFGDWSQLAPTAGAARGLVTDTESMDLLVTGDISVSSSDWTQLGADVSVTLNPGDLDLQDSTWQSLDGTGAPINTLTITSSGANQVQDGSQVRVRTVDIDGASGSWDISGTDALTASSIEGKTITIGGGGANVDSVQLGPYGSLVGSSRIEADVSVTVDATAAFIDADGAGACPGDAAPSAGADGNPGAAGGGYGGAGGDGGAGIVGGTWYDSAFAPTLGGSHGGSAASAPGGCAGGLGYVAAPTCTLFGEIRARGLAGADSGGNSGGGGAGGLVYVGCPTLTLAGGAQLLAGGGSSTVGGGGGGGRVMIRTDANTAFVCSVAGGVGGNADGEVGTCGLVVDNALPAHDDLHVASGFRLQGLDPLGLSDDSLTYNPLNSLDVAAGTRLSGAFAGTIDIDTSWIQAAPSQWDPTATAVVNASTISWPDGACVGHDGFCGVDETVAGCFRSSAGTPYDVDLNVSISANVRGAFCGQTVTVRPLGGGTPSIVLGQDGVAAGPMVVGAVDIQGVGALTHFDPYAVLLTGTGDPAGVGSGAGTDASLSGGGGGGAGHGGDGADGDVQSTPAPGGSFFASSRAPGSAGSGGGTGKTATDLAAGGAGGGGLVWQAATMTLEGSIDLDGADGAVDNAVGGGGGAGGGGLFEATVFAVDPVTFNVSAAGGDGGVGSGFSGGGGGGGRLLFLSHDTSGSAVARGQALAAALSTDGSVTPGLNGSTPAQPGTMGVLLDFGDADATNDQLFGIGGWRNESVDAPHVYQVYDLTRQSPLVTDGAMPVTIAADQILLSGVTWTTGSDLTWSTQQLSVTGSTLDVATYFDGTTAQFGIQTLMPWTDSRLVAGSGITIDGSSTSGWALTTTSFETPGLITLGNTTEVRVNDGGTCSAGAVRCGFYGDTTIDTGTLQLGANTDIFADARGNPSATGAGAGSSGVAGGGAGYGGRGGVAGGGAQPGAHYDSALNPTLDVGSGGGAGADVAAVGGRGGGVIDVHVTGTATVNGLISANGGDSTSAAGVSGGGGSGGGIRLRANILAGSGQFMAQGGDAAVAATQGGGGGGGRIAVYTTDLTGFTGISQTTVAAGAGFAAPLTDDRAQPGTAGFIDTDDLDIRTVSSWRFETQDVASYRLYDDFTATRSTVDGVGLIQPTTENLVIELGGTVTLGDLVRWRTGGNQLVLRADGLVVNNTGAQPAIDTDGANFIVGLGSLFQLNNNALIDLATDATGPVGTLSISGTSTFDLNNSASIRGDVIFLGDAVETSVGSLIEAIRGYQATISAGTGGPGTPTPAVALAGGSGAGHGGLGGRGDLNALRGLENDEEVAPVELGSSGGLAHDGTGLVAGTAGRGGGRVRLQAAGGGTLFGSIDVSGNAGSVVATRGGGGGAGGAVYVSAATLDVDAAAIVDATGGAGANDALDGGGGAGGRVALCSDAGTVASVNLFVSGGPGGDTSEAGSAGTVTTNCTPATLGAVVLVATNTVHQANIQVPATGTDLPLMAFTVTELGGLEGAELGFLTFTASGTLDETTEVQDWRLLVDVNLNGIADGSDTLLAGPATFNADDGTLDFDLSGTVVAAGTSLDLLVVADTAAAAVGGTIEFSMAADADLAVLGETSGAIGQVLGAPVESGVKTVAASPLPVVMSFTPDRRRNDSAFSIDVFGLNLTGVTAADFNASPVNSFASVTPIDDTHFSGSVVASAPLVNPGFYDVRATTAAGTNSVSAQKFEFFAFCDTGQPGACGEGELVGSVCVQTVFPEAEVCGNGIDEDCSGADLSCNGVDDDGDGFPEDAGDCDDDDDLNNPNMGLVCVIDEIHVPSSDLSGEPRNISSHHLSEDSLSPGWRNDPGASWFTMAGESLAGGAVLLDGVGDYAEVVPSASLTPQTFLTVSAWVRFDALPPSAVAIAYKGGNTAAELDYGLVYDSGQFRFLLRTVDGGSHQRVANSAILLGRWYQLVGTYDSDSGVMRLYVDGLLVDSATLPGSPGPAQGSGSLFVGEHGAGLYAGVDGRIDEVRVFGRVLTAAEIATDNTDLRQNGASSLATDEQRLHLSFDSGFDDSSGTGNDATAQGNAAVSGRSGRYEFPALAYAVSTSGGVDIFDENHVLWLRIPVSTTPGVGVLQEATGIIDIDFAELANGVLAVGSRSATQGLTVFDFPADQIVRFTTAGRQLYIGDFRSLLTGAYAAADPAWSLPDNEITGLAVTPSGDDVLIGVGMPGYLAAFDLGPGGDRASVALAAGADEAAALTFGTSGNLYYGVNPSAGAPVYRVIADAATWIAGGGGTTGVTAMTLPGGATILHDADFAQRSSGGTYTLTVAHDAGVTSGVASPAVAGGSEVTKTTTSGVPQQLLGPDDDVVSVALDFDMEFSAIPTGGLTLYDYEVGQVAQFVDDDYATTDGIARLETLDIRGVAGFSEVAVAHALGVSFLPIPLGQGPCNTGLLGACADGVVYPLPGPPVPDTICVQDVFPSHEFCADGIDSNCDGDDNPPATVCSTGVPLVSLGADLFFNTTDDQPNPALKGGCDPIPLSLPVPTVVDDTDPAPEVRCWTSRPDSVVVNGAFGDWDAGDEVGDLSGVATLHSQFTESTWSFYIDGVDLDGSNLGVRIAISETDDSNGCTVPGGESGAAFQPGVVVPNWVFEVDDSLDFGSRRCDTLSNTFFDELAVTPLVGVGPTGVEIKLDLTNPAFAGTELADPNGDNFIWVWVVDTTTDEVIETFPTGNPTGAAVQTFDTPHTFMRDVSPVTEAALGTFQYGCTATDFDGNSGSDSIAVDVAKIEGPVIIVPPDIASAVPPVVPPAAHPRDVEATDPAGTYVNIRCENGTETDPACADGTQWLDTDIAPPGAVRNCATPIQVTQNAPAGQLFPLSLPAAYTPTTVTWTVTDNLGDVAQDTQLVRVVDTIGPTVDFILGGDVEAVGLEVWQYFDHPADGGPDPIVEADLAGYIVTDLGDVAADITCAWEDPLPAYVAGVLTPTELTCTDRSGNATVATLWVMVRPTAAAPPIQATTTDLTRYFNVSPSSFDLQVGDDGTLEDTICMRDEPGVGLVDMPPAVSIEPSAAPWLSVITLDPYNFDVFVDQEGVSVVTVTVMSLCTGLISEVDYYVGIDVTDPVLVGYNAASGAPRDVSDPADPSTYKGYFRYQDSPTFLLTGQVQDTICGVETITAELHALDPTDGSDLGLVTNVISEVESLSGTPAQGPINVFSIPCTDATWCDPFNLGLEVPLDPVDGPLGPYRIDVSVMDCAGNTSPTRELYFYVIDLELALTRMDDAITRWLTLVDVSVHPDLLEAQTLYRHALAAHRQGFLPTAVVAMQHADPLIEDVIVAVNGANPVEAAEMTEKLVELATGGRTEARILWADADASGDFLDDDQAVLSDARLVAAKGGEAIGPAGALLDVRAALFHLDLSLSGWAQEDFEDPATAFVQALNLLDETIVDINAYIDALVIEPDLLGVPEMQAMADMLEEARYTMWCQCRDRLGSSACGTGPGGGAICEGFEGPFFVGLDEGIDAVPSSLELAENILRMMEGQILYGDAELAHVYTETISFNSALAATVIVNEGLYNACANMCGCFADPFLPGRRLFCDDADTHPLIKAACDHWDLLELRRAQMVSDFSYVNDYQALATSIETRCLVSYVYNAAYQTDTECMDMNYCGEELMEISLVGCDPPPVGNTFLNTLYAEQDLYATTTCACSGGVDTRCDLDGDGATHPNAVFCAAPGGFPGTCPTP